MNINDDGRSLRLSRIYNNLISPTENEKKYLLTLYTHLVHNIHTEDSSGGHNCMERKSSDHQFSPHDLDMKTRKQQFGIMVSIRDQHFTMDKENC